MLKIVRSYFSEISKAVLRSLTITVLPKTFFRNLSTLLSVSPFSFTNWIKGCISSDACISKTASFTSSINSSGSTLIWPPLILLLMLINFWAWLANKFYMYKSIPVSTMKTNILFFKAISTMDM